MEETVDFGPFQDLLGRMNDGREEQVVPVAGYRLLLYMDPAGQQKFAYARTGELDGLSVIGALEMIKADMQGRVALGWERV